MLFLIRRSRQWLPLVSGLVLGLSATLWTTLHAAALMPNLLIAGLSSGSTVSGIVSLSAQADAIGLSGLQFQVSGQNVGSEITAGSCATSWDTRALADGTHTVTAVGRDSVGNTTWAPAITVNVQNTVPDTTAPIVALSAPTAGASVSGSVTINASATDNTAVASAWFALDGTTLGAEDTTAPYQAAWNTTAVSNGTHTLRAFARDAAGNTGSSSLVSITVNNVVTDTTAPSVSIIAPGTGTTVSGTISVAATATDSVGIAGVQFKLDGVNLGAEDTTAPYSVSWSTTTAANGSHQLTAVARDASGNSATSAPSAVTVSNTTADTTLPNVSITAPTSRSTVRNTVSVSASASDNVGVIGVQFTLDGVNLGAEDTAAPFTMSWDTTAASNGSHTLRAVARDAAGNPRTSSGRTVTVSNTVDSVMPTVSITAPSPSVAVAGTVTVSASATDNVGVAGVQFTVDGANLGPEVSTGPFTATWVTTAAMNGSHSVRAIARDRAGNAATSTAVLVSVSNAVPDTTLPSVSMTSPTAGSAVSGVVQLAASASDNVGIAGVQFLIDGLPFGAEVLRAPYVQSWSTSALPAGTYALSAVARDTAGNKRTSAPISVTLSNGPGTTARAVPGDIDADGRPDLLWAHNTGLLYAWMLNGATLLRAAPLAPGSVDPSWRIASIDDFDGDGQNDLLWQNTSTGLAYIWLMNRLSLTRGVPLASAGTSWRVMTTGDFNGDGKADIVWQQNTTGALYVWFMNGTTELGRAAMTPGQVDPAWRIVGAADLNRDGKTDLVWQHATSGALQAWFLNGVTLVSTVPLTPATVAPAWRVKAVVDLDSDGMADIVWQSTAGQLYVWYMNGTVCVRGVALSPGQVDPAWEVVGGR